MFNIGSHILICRSCLLSVTCRRFRPDPIRFITNKTPSKTKTEITQKRVAFIKKIWLINYMTFIKSYEQNLEKRFPKMKVMRVFNSGIKNLYLDIKKYISIKKKQRERGMERLSRDELELIFTLPKDLLKVSPVLLISVIPFTNYVVFPMIFIFPRIFLISHFWTFEQKLDFLLYDQKRRLRFNEPLLRCLQEEVENIRHPRLKIKWSSVIASLGSGTHPTASDILATKELFTGPPYSLTSLKMNHVVCTIQIYLYKTLYHEGIIFAILSFKKSNS